MAAQVHRDSAYSKRYISSIFNHRNSSQDSKPRRQALLVVFLPPAGQCFLCTYTFFLSNDTAGIVVSCPAAMPGQHSHGAVMIMSVDSRMHGSTELVEWARSHRTCSMCAVVFPNSASQNFWAGVWKLYATSCYGRKANAYKCQRHKQPELLLQIPTGTMPTGLRS